MRNLAHHLSTIGVPKKFAEVIQTEVTDTYTKRHGGYHDLNHIQRVLTYFEKVSSDIENVGYSAAIVAIWFHDYVYQGNADDVKESAKAVVAFLTNNHVEPGYIELVRNMVLATDYSKKCSCLDGGLTSAVRAADIAAACSGTYAQFLINTERVATECNMNASSVTFRAKRIKALKPLLPIIMEVRYVGLYNDAVRNLDRYTDELIAQLAK